MSASSFYLRGDLGWSWLNTENNNDSVFLLGGGVGYRFNENLRADARIDYAGIGNEHHDFGSVLGNVYFDIPTGPVITPYRGCRSRLWLVG